MHFGNITKKEYIDFYVGMSDLAFFGCNHAIFS